MAQLPVCTRARVGDGSSREIDDRVRSLVSSGLSIYDVDAGLLKELRPSLILTQDQCEVCAVSPRDLVAALAAWMGRPPEIVSLQPSDLGGVWSDWVRVARAAEVDERGRELAARLADRVSTIGEQTGALEERPSVACIEWIDPLVCAGHWMPELITLAGGRTAFGRPGGPSSRISWEELHAIDPDDVVVAPCGFDLARTGRELALPGVASRLARLRSVREGRIAAVDGNAYCNRPGPRLVESLEILAEILHPDRFRPRHEGRGWLRV